MNHKTVKIGENHQIGQFVVIEKDVTIGRNVKIGHHVVIKQGTIIGDDVVIKDFTLLGQSPSTNKIIANQKANKLSNLIINDNVTIGSHAIIYQGTIINN